MIVSIVPLKPCANQTRAELPLKRNIWNQAIICFAVGLSTLGCAPFPRLASTMPPQHDDKAPADPVLFAAMERIRKQIGSQEAEAFVLVDQGRWGEALRKLDELDLKWKGTAPSPLMYSGERAEALIGLERYSEAIDALEDPNAKISFPLAYDLARAEVGELDPQTAFKDAQMARESYSFEGKMPPEIARPKSKAEIVACVRLARAAADQNNPHLAELEARKVLTGYPKQPIASYILIHALDDQNRWREADPYWEPAVVLPGPRGENAMMNCHRLYPNRKEFAPPPPPLGPNLERSGPITPNLQREIDRQKAIIESLKRKP